MTTALPLRLLKLRYWDEHVHAVPLTGLEGEPFTAPGVDLRGEAARYVFGGSDDLLAALAELEPGVRVRAISIDFERPRLTATLEPLAVPFRAGRSPRSRPRVARIDAPGIVEPLLARSEDAIERAGLACRRALERRRAPRR